MSYSSPTNHETSLFIDAERTASETLRIFDKLGQIANKAAAYRNKTLVSLTTEGYAQRT